MSASIRTAVVGIGQELRGDDALGVEVARRLKPLAAKRTDWIIIEAGPAPENFTGTLRRFGPERVFLIDAALMGEEPGAVRLIDWREASGFSASTHSLPLSVFAGYLAGELGCEVLLVGVQPGQNALGAPLSAEVQRAADEVVQNILALMEKNG